MRRWVVPLLWSLLAAVAAFVVLDLSGHDPDPLRFAAATVLVLVCGLLVVGLLRTDVPDWSLGSRTAAWPRGQDEGLGRVVRAIDAHTWSEMPDSRLQQSLRGVAASRLRRRHALSLADPRARDLLGPDLHDLLTGATTRIAPADLARHLERIERL